MGAVDHGLGRRWAPDERDGMFRMAAVVPDRASIARTWRYWWPSGAWHDQGGTGTCVGHAWAHYLEDGPVTHADATPDPYGIYRGAVLIDEWSGNDSEAQAPQRDLQFGTSVRAGAKVLQRAGYVGAYVWARTVDEVVAAILTDGPVVAGTAFTEGMAAVGADGMMDTGGRVIGGHAYLLDGVNVGRGVFRVKNSWGRSWGRSGFGWLPIDAFAELLADRGEACLAVELRPSAVRTVH